MFNAKKPKTTPECEQLLNIVLTGLHSSPVGGEKQESACVALKKLRKNRCVKAFEYIMQVSCGYPYGFGVEVCQTARKYLDELS
jgi:hypothetical protein